MSKNWKDRLTMDNVKREGINTLYVAIGLLGATAIDRGVQKITEKWLPSIAPYVNYIKPGAAIIGGLTMSVLAEDGRDGDRMRLIGYGVSGAGVISALRLIPQVDAFLSDTPDATKTISGLSGLNLLGLSLGDFGKTENIREISAADAEETSIELPDLGYIAPKTASTQSKETAVSDVEFEEILADVI